jgi:hypothetical protein
MEVGDEGRWDLEEIKPFVPDHDHMTVCHISAHDPTRVVDSDFTSTCNHLHQQTCIRKNTLVLRRPRVL